MTALRKKQITFAIKSTGADEGKEDGTFSGLGSVFGNVDSYGDVVVKGAFEKSLAKHKKEGTLPAMLWQHKSDEPIGIYTRMQETDEGLDLDGQYALEVVRGREAHVLTKMRALRGLSIGFSVPKGGMEWDDDKGIMYLKEIDLWEVSVVTFPANGAANISDVRTMLKSGDLPTERDFEAVLRDAGFSHTLAKACVAKGYREVLREADKTGRDSTDALLKHINNLASRIRSQ